MSAPPIKRIVSTGASAITLPAMPTMPMSAAAPKTMAGASGTNLGLSAGPMAAAGSQSGGGPVSLFGLREAKAGGLPGAFYDLKQDRSRQPISMGGGKYLEVLQDFVKTGWPESKLGTYYQAPEKLFATQIFIPRQMATEGPKAFQVEKEVEPKLWVVLYKGRVIAPENGTFSFVGKADDHLYVRFDEKTVLDGSDAGKSALAKAEARYDWGHGGPPFVKGEAFEVEKGRSYPIEILIGERPGGAMHFFLLIEKQGTSYEKKGPDPILPIFRMVEGPPPPPSSFPPFTPTGPVWKVEAGNQGKSIFKTELPRTKP
jgi:hypothetical protein